MVQTTQVVVRNHVQNLSDTQKSNARAQNPGGKSFQPPAVSDCNFLDYHHVIDLHHQFIRRAHGGMVGQNSRNFPSPPASHIPTN